MREATVVAFVLPQGPCERGLVAGWAGLCIGVGAAGLAGHAALAADAAAPVFWATVAAWVGGAVAAALAWRMGPSGQWHLAWHGQAWRLALGDATGAARDGQVEPMIDLGGWLLLKFLPADGSRAQWLSTGAARLGPCWHVLRAALFRPDGPSAARRLG
jgi:hypothetical protein